jgi:hypothetical protein
MKLCINCKHVVLKQNDTEHEFPRCSYQAIPSPVHGKIVVQDLSYCKVLRMGRGTTNCGLEGDYFEEANNV